jgi:molybdate transport system ATP-binding protein
VVHRPELLVLDEPDASLDEAGRGLLDDLLAGRTAVVATHDAGLARALCDRTLVLRDGRQVPGRGADEGQNVRPPEVLAPVRRG